MLQLLIHLYLLESAMVYLQRQLFQSNLCLNNTVWNNIVCYRYDPVCRRVVLRPTIAINAMQQRALLVPELIQ